MFGQQTLNLKHLPGSKSARDGAFQWLNKRKELISRSQNAWRARSWLAAAACAHWEGSKVRGDPPLPDTSLGEREESSGGTILPLEAPRWASGMCLECGWPWPTFYPPRKVFPLVRPSTPSVWAFASLRASVKFANLPPWAAQIRLAESGLVRICEGLRLVSGWGGWRRSGAT